MTRWLLLLAVPAVAAAEPRIETIDRGDAIEVIAREITAADTTITPVRSRLEIPVADAPDPIRVRAPDPAIVVTELGKRALSIKLAHDRGDVKALAPRARAIQVGPDLHVLIPRTLAVTSLPDPTPVVVAPAAAIAPPMAPAAGAPPAARTSIASSIPNTSSGIANVPPAGAPDGEIARAPIASGKTDHPAQPAQPAQLASAPPSPLSRPSVLAVLALAAIGGGVWLMRRRKGNPEAASSIDIIAQRSLGAKAKVVWLAAGSREMVVAVTPQQVRVLGQWKKTDGPAERASPVELPHAQVVDLPAKQANPAVAGILKLRAKTVPPPATLEPRLDDDIATGDLEADALWAKEILQATRSSGHGR